MDWKQEAVEKLYGYALREQSVKSLQEELEQLNASAAGIRSSQTDRTPTQRGGSWGKDKILSGIVNREELESRLSEAQRWIKTVDGALAVLTPEEREILDRCYIHRHKDAIGALCESLCLEKSAVYDRRDKALRRFTIALYGVTESI